MDRHAHVLALYERRERQMVRANRLAFIGVMLIATFLGGAMFISATGGL